LTVSNIEDNEGSEGSQDEFHPAACEDNGDSESDGESEVPDDSEVTKKPRTKKGKKTKASRKDVTAVRQTTAQKPTPAITEERLKRKADETVRYVLVPPV
jgi:hypothetical protein